MGSHASLQYGDRHQAWVRVPLAIEDQLSAPAVQSVLAEPVCQSTMTDGATHTGKPEIAKSADAGTRVEEEVCRFHVTMDDSSRVNVAQCSEHASKIRFDALHRQRAIVFLAG